ncbi:MAG: hypothetical protein JRI23_05600, partial [Deltaproteobacteria bacterium]|nr:hypothetical protein [Deltaproteobacteria bacterium]MBW2531036.1 hypothetical protein [Deltaproteobacteria bacterium]
MSSSSTAERATIRQRLGRGAVWLAVGSWFLSALIAGAVLHSNTPVGRRVACRVLNAALESLFLGRVEVSRVDALRLHEIRLAEVTVASPDGREILRARGARLRARTVRLLGQALSRRPVVRIRLAEIRIEEAQLELEPGRSGAPSLVDAFTLREPPQAEVDPAARPVVVTMPRIELGRVTLRGTLPSTEGEGAQLDLDLARLAGSLRVGPGDEVVVNVARTGLVERGLVGVPVAGSLNAHLRTAPLRGWGDFVGHLGELEVQARAQLEGEELSVRAMLPKVGPDELEPLLPGHPVVVPFVGQVTLSGKPPAFDVGVVAAFPRFNSTARRGSLTASGRLLATASPLLDLQVAGTDVDTRVFGGAALPARISGRARLRGRIDGADSEVRVCFDARGTDLDGGSLPGAAGTVVLDASQMQSWLRAAESGQSADVSL